MSGPALTDFFRQFGAQDSYPCSGAPSRWSYTSGRLSDLNETDRMRLCIEATVDPRRFMGTGLETARAVDFLNEALAYDGWRLVRHGRSYVLRPNRDVDVEFGLPEGATADQMADFIRQQVEKCQAKLAGDDHDGAITNARSLIEAVLRDLEDKLSGAPQEYDGNRPRLYRRVQKAMKLDPADYQEMADVQQLLRGLTTIVDGLSGMSNELADRHAGRRRPPPHHARLAVNAANTLCSFLVDSYRRQRGQP